MSEPRNQGHGHVVPRPDGVRARCGGPALCRVCQAERAALESAPQASKPTQVESDAIRQARHESYSEGYAAGKAFAAAPLPVPPSPFDKLVYAACESGGHEFKVILGFDTLKDAQSAHQFIARRAAAPAPVDPESQGSSEQRLSDRDLIDRFDL